MDKNKPNPNKHKGPKPKGPGKKGDDGKGAMMARGKVQKTRGMAMLRMGMVAIILFHTDAVGYSCLLLVPILALTGLIYTTGTEGNLFSEETLLVTR